MIKNFIKLLENESGATAIEYALIASLVSIAAILAMGSVGSGVNNEFSKAASNLSAAR